MAKSTSCWKTAAACTSGLGKPERNKVCEDAVCLDGSRKRVVMAIGDGAGHANYTHAALASAIATDVAVRFAKSSYDGMMLESLRDAHAIADQVVVRVRSALRATAMASGVEMRVFATTLSFCYVTDEVAVCAHIGDSPIVVEHMDGRLELVSRPRDDDQASNVTNFISDPNYALHLRTVRIHEPIRSIAVFSDGLEIAALREGKTPHPEFFEPLFSWAAMSNHREKTKRLHDFLRRDDVQQLSGDDMSIALGTRRNSSNG